MNLEFCEFFVGERKNPPIGENRCYCKLDFLAIPTTDFMVRGGVARAFYNEETGFWTTNLFEGFEIMDKYLDQEADKWEAEHGEPLTRHYIRNTRNNVMYDFIKYCKNRPELFRDLNQTLIFADSEVHKDDYATFRLDYALRDGPCPAWDELLTTLYPVPEEMDKTEYLIGSLISGRSKELQKAWVYYGDASTGKSTIMKVIKWLLGWTVLKESPLVGTIDVQAMGSSGEAFKGESLKNDPYVAMQDDAKLDAIDDNTMLNSLISHEEIVVNSKYEKKYSKRFYSTVIIGTNSPVRITDSRSGLTRRIIDIHPGGRRSPFPRAKYDELMRTIQHVELGAIAYKCLKKFEKMGIGYYDDYIPVRMMAATNDFYNFIETNYEFFANPDGITLKAAWDKYDKFCEMCNVRKKPFQALRLELQNYYRYYSADTTVNGVHVRNYFNQFKTEKFKDMSKPRTFEIIDIPDWLKFKEQESEFDKAYADCPAQLAVEDENGRIRPQFRWVNCRTKLKDIDTHELHYVQIPEQHIVMDFDKKNVNGEKDYELNARAAMEWPKTYAELSRSGGGIHLHYLYAGDVKQLADRVSDDIEIKTLLGDQSLRRKLTKCNDLPIARIESGLPLKEKKGEDTVWSGFENEKHLANVIKNHLRYKSSTHTAECVQLIGKALDSAYEQSKKDPNFNYDLSTYEPIVMTFAQKSDQAEALSKAIKNDFHFVGFGLEKELQDYGYSMAAVIDSAAKHVSKDTDIEWVIDDDGNEYYENLWFIDIESYPNMFCVCALADDPKIPPVQVDGPPPELVSVLTDRPYIGHNCKLYDNHMLYGAMMGESVIELNNRSTRLISNDRTARFSNATNMSLCDTLDMMSSKSSLKAEEIRMRKEWRKKHPGETPPIRHQEMYLDWTKPVPDDCRQAVMDYCLNDCYATRALFHDLKGDWKARQILAALSGLTVNDSTNSHTTKIIFGNDRNPNLIYTDLKTGIQRDKFGDIVEDKSGFINKFPEYDFIDGKNMYLGYDVGFGGRVFATPGVWYDVPTLDIKSMHPHSAIAMNMFNDIPTGIFKGLVDARVCIKEHRFDDAVKLLEGKLAPFLKDQSDADNLAQALKIAINSVYGLTSASFKNPFRDERNVNNICALRGALFMTKLQKEVEARGYTVVHIKTDSIKIAEADPEIIQFCKDFAIPYGYEFDHESTYDRICLVNDAVFIAKYADEDWCMQHYGYIPGKNKKYAGEWTATGKQFQVPYVFKTLFSHEPIDFDDMCETKKVQKGVICIDRNEGMPDDSALEKEFKKLKKKEKDEGGLSDEDMARKNSLIFDIGKCHNYEFVGRIGEFTPILPGHGGGLLVRKTDDGYSAVTGTKGYRWLESDYVRENHMEDFIDKSYYDDLVNKARAAIDDFYDIGDFLNDNRPLEYYMNPPAYDEDEVPFN